MVVKTDWPNNIQSKHASLPLYKLIGLMTSNENVHHNHCAN